MFLSESYFTDSSTTADSSKNEIHMYIYIYIYVRRAKSIILLQCLGLKENFNAPAYVETLELQAKPNALSYISK